jgi:hypothetical protein
METTHETSHLLLDTRGLVQCSIMDVHTSFVWIIMLFDEVSKHGDRAKFLGYVGRNGK